MLRLIMCGLLLTAFGSAARAGELDRETAPPATGAAKSVPVTTSAAAGSEMDSESPSQSHYWRGGWGRPWGWGGYGHGWGGYGWGGYSPFRVSFGWGGYPGYWGGGWGGGWGYPYRGWYGGFYPAYSSWGWGGWGYRGWGGWW